MKKTGSNIVISLLTFFLVPFAGFLISSSIDLYKAVTSNSWPTTNGIVISSRVDTTIYTRVETVRNNSRSGIKNNSVRKKTVKSAMYAAIITYKYQIEGVEYKSSNYTANQGYQELVKVNDLVSKFPVNKDVTVHYNPKKPGDALILVGIQGGEIFWTIFPLVITLVLLFLLLKQILKRKSLLSDTSDISGTNLTTDSKKFDDFFNFNIKQKLVELEAKRSAASSIHNWKTYRRIMLVLLVLDVVVVILFNQKIIPAYMFAIIPVSLVFAILYPLVVLYKKGAKMLPINDEFKQRVIPELVSFVNSNLRYEKEKGIPQTEFNRTRLFSNSTIYTSEDLITGEINGISYQMADVKAKIVHSSHGTQSGNSSRRSVDTIFEGLYIIATYNKDFGPPVYFRYKNIGQALVGNIQNYLGNELSKQLVTTEPKGISIETINSDFNAAFKVKCENEEQAKALITPAFINMMLTLNRKYDGQPKQLISPVNVFISSNQVHIALNEADIFDLNAFTTIVASNYTKRYYDLLNLSIELAETLK
jgi:hypothetical protein